MDFGVGWELLEEGVEFELYGFFEGVEFGGVVDLDVGYIRGWGGGEEVLVFGVLFCEGYFWWLGWWLVLGELEVVVMDLGCKWVVWWNGIIVEK